MPGLCETPNGSFRVLQDSGRGWLQGKGLKRQRVPISAMPRIELRILPPQTCLQTASNPRGSRDFSSLAVNQNQWFAHVCTIRGQGRCDTVGLTLGPPGWCTSFGQSIPSCGTLWAAAPWMLRAHGVIHVLLDWIPIRPDLCHLTKRSIAIAFFCVPVSELDMATQETCKQLVHTPSCTKF